MKIGLEFKFKFPRNHREKELKKDKVQKPKDGEFDERGGQVVILVVELE